VAAAAQVLRFLLHSPAELRALITGATAGSADTSAPVDAFLLGRNKVRSHSISSCTDLGNLLGRDVTQQNPDTTSMRSDNWS